LIAASLDTAAVADVGFWLKQREMVQSGIGLIIRKIRGIQKRYSWKPENYGFHLYPKRTERNG